MEVMDYSEETPQMEGAEEDRSEESDNNDIADNNDNADNNVETEVQADEINDESKAKKAKETLDESDVDSDQSCPICMDLWTSSGEHRLCCLRCGHLFGYNCILRWLQTSCTSGNRRCPQCNRKAAAKDIRMLYAKKLTSIDTAELDKLKKQLNSVTAEKNHIEMELSKYALRQKLFEQQVSSMRNRISELENQQSEISVHSCQNISKHMTKKFHLDRSIEICKDGGCRVLDYNPWYGFLVVSQKSTSSLFSGYGIKKIDSDKFQPRQFIFLHSQAIRDVTFNSSQQSILLSVGFDKCAKLMDIQNHIIMHTYQTDFPLWSCCWSGDNPNIFLAGAQNGSITQFDIRHTSGPIETLDSPGDRSPVVSLASVPPNAGSAISRGGFIACRLSTCYAYEQKESKYIPKQIFLEGPFVSVCYDEKNNHALISSRPNARQPHARHVVCTIEKGNEESTICNVVHTFHAGNSQQLLSRPCYINIENDTLIAAHQESTSCISLWSMSTGKQVNNLPVSDPVVDMCTIDVNSHLFLATLSAKKVRIYSHG
ncbi:PREDICTED: E3 ubiquitin-protein ligase RFWD3 isoform X2 [Dufourea novaeangliae]|uniref:E3 ubiquitin-protein ligase RFWD3 isoform X2 n=1 Tax=Dufourea novaeangliae TaxID=178035 RepID=UPI0007671163|nr:PREDICTED: E3 ubiquitin-protein ligase RFWD3 isoform X2 [Dufourea novaeangliae]